MAMPSGSKSTRAYIGGAGVVGVGDVERRRTKARVEMSG